VLPPNLRDDLAANAAEVITAALASGWNVSDVVWNSRSERRVAFGARKEGATSVYIVCSEDELLDRLERTFRQSP
jgi:hypothetical protein